MSINFQDNVKTVKIPGDEDQDKWTMIMVCTLHIYLLHILYYSKPLTAHAIHAYMHSYITPINILWRQEAIYSIILPKQTGAAKD